MVKEVRDGKTGQYGAEEPGSKPSEGGKSDCLNDKVVSEWRAGHDSCPDAEDRIVQSVLLQQ